jgi:hypothetical protein
MTWSSDARAGRDAAGWALLAAAILALQGASLIVYAGILRPVVAAIELPVLGHADITYLVTGVFALVAAAGIGLRRPWGRVLGMIAAMTSGLLALVTAPSAPPAIVGLVLPAIVVVLLWRQWPRPNVPQEPPELHAEAGDGSGEPGA